MSFDGDVCHMCFNPGFNLPDLITTFKHVNVFQVSLMMTIVGLAQNFVGSNNLNLLQPLGQFGTRLHGGKDSASPRYIFTMLRSVPALTWCQYSKVTGLLSF